MAVAAAAATLETATTENVVAWVRELAEAVAALTTKQDAEHQNLHRAQRTAGDKVKNRAEALRNAERELKTSEQASESTQAILQQHSDEMDELREKLKKTEGDMESCADEGKGPAEIHQRLGQDP